ncbi:major facilitator superfamily domain-containing protein [Mycena albidolilacea]|uniref:Major facilitator superfamily domain-containing protein n=1 Tax=Mycena albidolilacea TaxID=1033008 RepID=A0AAD6ZJY0_9AGAR|nr:major facilitator superfamily domain-containing protein [Mycena albidolilacea]
MTPTPESTLERANVESKAPRKHSGTREAWTTLIGAFLLQFCVVGPVMSFGVFQDFYSTEFLKSQSASNISWIGGLQLFLYLGCGTLGGKLYDSGYCRETLICGSLLFVFNFFMLSITEPGHYYQVFLCQGLGMGIGAAMVYVPTFTVVSAHFKSQRALAMGILSASSPLGTIIFTILLNQMIYHGPGFAWAIRTGAFLVLGCFVASQFLITILEPAPSSPGLQPDGELIKSITGLPYLLTLLAGFTAQLGTLFPTFYLQIFAQTHGFSKPLTFYTPVIMNVATILGRIIPNFAADRWGTVEVYIVCLAANGIVGFGMLGAGKTAGLICFSVFFGFFFGSSISLYLPVVSVLVPREAQMGRIMGIALFPVGISSLIGPPIAGRILGSEMAWWKAIVLSSVVLLTSSVILTIARIVHVRHTILAVSMTAP